MKKLLASADDVFTGASVSNLHTFCGLFDKIFVLTLQEDILRQRLVTRPKDDDYGKHPDDLARVLEVMETEKARLIEHDDAIVLDASQPLESVIDEILTSIHAN